MKEFIRDLKQNQLIPTQKPPLKASKGTYFLSNRSICKYYAIIFMNRTAGQFVNNAHNFDERTILICKYYAIIFMNRTAGQFVNNAHNFDELVR